MRHVLLPGAPATGPYRMGQAPTAARLVAPTGGTLGVISGLLRTAAGTIDLTAVAAAANKHLGPTTDTHEQPGRRRHRRGLAHAWTTIAMLGIMPRHACLARCGARRRFGTWRFRSAPCLPNLASGQRAIVRSIHLVTSAAHADLWICGQRKRVAHRPTGSKNKSKRQFDCFGSTALKPGPSQPRPSARAAATPVAAFGTYPGRHSQAAPVDGFKGSLGGVGVKPFTLTHQGNRVK
jgi:hypothetical protein